MDFSSWPHKNHWGDSVRGDNFHAYPIYQENTLTKPETIKMKTDTIMDMFCSVDR